MERNGQGKSCDEEESLGVVGYLLEGGSGPLRRPSTGGGKSFKTGLDHQVEEKKAEQVTPERPKVEGLTNQSQKSRPSGGQKKGTLKGEGG